ncbi:XVIPCD domain-containing protein [Xanthomonas bundabergensis]|uniref:XVIPCD domain-containing protein n=1 Tax=Xanthomonas bundabergensis TaxID=3160842 RepID=UPI003511C120
MANDDDLKKMLDTFEAAHAKEGQALRKMLDNTPELKARVEQAIEQKQLSGFAPHPRDGGGSYNTETGRIQLPMDVLRTAKMDAPRDDSANTARIILGHEIGHAINKTAIEKSDDAFKDKIDQIAKSPSPHDYTEVLKAHGAEQRTRESKDEIAGVNTLADYVKHSNPKATLKDLYNASTEMASYIDKTGEGAKATYKAKDGLTFGSDLKIDANSPKNVEAMGKLFYDARGYPQNYGARDLGLVAEAEDAAQLRDPKRVQPEVRADLKALGIDQGKVPPSWIPNGFRDTGATLPAPRAAAPAAEPTGADRALHDKVRSGVAQAEQALGKGWDDNSERMTASLTLLARQSGFNERDQLSVGFNKPTATHQGGELAFVYRDGATASPDPYANRAQMPTSEAIARPAQETYQQLQEQTAQQAQTQRTVQAQEQATQAQTQATSPPVLTR